MVTSVTSPDHELRHARILLRRLLHKLWKLFVLAEPELDLESLDWYRAGGDVECESCGLVYFEHPADPREPWLTMLCGGQRVKL